MHISSSGYARVPGLQGSMWIYIVVVGTVDEKIYIRITIRLFSLSWQSTEFLAETKFSNLPNYNLFSSRSVFVIEMILRCNDYVMNM